MLNAVVCQKCLPDSKEDESTKRKEVGFMLPVTPTDLASPWQCSACGGETPASEVMATLLR